MKKKFSGILATVLSITILVTSSNGIILAKGSAEDDGANTKAKIEKNIDSTRKIVPSTKTKQWKNKKGKVSFPIDSSSEQWSEFESHDEMLEACAIPDELLVELTTDELIDLVLDYPLLGDMMVYNTYQQGLEAVAENFNGLKELLSREEGAKKLLKKYCNTDIIENSDVSQKDMEKVEKISDMSKISDTVLEKLDTEYQSVVDVAFMETCLAQKDMIENLSENEQKKLNEETEKKYMKKSKSEVHKGKETVFYEALIESNQLDRMGIEYVKNKEVDTSSDIVAASTDNSDYVKTPKGKKVKVLYRGELLSLAEKVEYKEWLAKKYPKATYKSAATTNYNCHSYAWYMSSTSNKCWMNDPGAYISDESYKKVGTSPTTHYQVAIWICAPSVDYYVHSAICISYYTKEMISKWGPGPLVQHAYNYSPYQGTIYYYKYNS